MHIMHIFAYSGLCCIMHLTAYFEVFGENIAKIAQNPAKK